MKIKRSLLAVMALAAGLMAAPALGETETYTYGGSGDESIEAIAVSEDGRILMTGRTNSADGTLADRTKTGRSGWALCVDGSGEVRFSFVSRLGNHDIMTSPVWHEDGTATLVLEAETDGVQEFEAIRLDAQGGVISRKTMLKTGGGVDYLRMPMQRFDTGYVIEESDDQLNVISRQRFSFDGALLGMATDWKTGVRVVAARHVIRIEEGQARLYRMDDAGEETAIAELFTVPESGQLPANYTALISLDDGGAAGCGWVLDSKTQLRKGRITRWDAQGNTVFDMWMETGRLWDLVKTEDGFAASSYPNETEEPEYEYHNCPWELQYFTEDGIPNRRVPLVPSDDPISSSVGCMLAAMPDGSVAAVQNFRADSDSWDGQIRLTVVPPQE